jgi:hypothetical protein
MLGVILKVVCLLRTGRFKIMPETKPADVPVTNERTEKDGECLKYIERKG